MGKYYPHWNCAAKGEFNDSHAVTEEIINAKVEVLKTRHG